MKRPSFVEAALALTRSWLSPSGPEQPPDAGPPPADRDDERPDEDDVRR